jgi:hypothetical protein
MNKPGTNTGHGHVWPRPDGIKARCGGPPFCTVCITDLIALRHATTSQSRANPEPACQESERGEEQVCDASDRYTVVQSGFWWRVRIGDGGQLVGKCYSRTEAEKLAAQLLRAFRDGHYAATHPAPPQDERQGGG